MEAIVSGRPYGSDWFFNSSGVIIKQEYVWIPPRATVTVARTGIFGQSDGIPYYTLAGTGPGGTQRLIIERVPTPLSVQGQRSIAPGSNATFEAVPHMTLTSYKWWVIYGDTLATPRNPKTLTLSTGARSIPSCDGLLTCNFAPTAGGRVYVEGRTPSYDYPRAFTEPFRVESQLEVSCGHNPAITGELVACTAGTKPSGGSITHLQWSYSGQAANVATAGTTWTANVATGGVVTVTGLVAGSQKSATDTLAVECNLLAAPTGDRYLDDPNVQRGLKDLWRRSNFGGSSPVEQGGWIVEDPSGKLSIVPFTSNTTNPRICSTNTAAAFPPGVTPQSYVHTHPHAKGGTVPADGSCNGFLPPQKFGDGPSMPDRKAAKKNPGVPLYVITPSYAHRYGHKLPAGSGATKFTRDQTCTI